MEKIPKQIIMKEITINGRTFQYKTIWTGGEYGKSPETIFYDGTESYVYRKYILFGKKIIGIKPREVFRIYDDSNSKRLTKDWWRTQIEKEIELLDRASELEKGELI